MSDIGVNIGLEGEVEFKKAIAQVNTSLKTLGTEMKAVTSAYDKNDTSAEKLTKTNDVLTKRYADQEIKVEMLKSRLAEAKAKFDENDASVVKLQQDLNLATADMNKTGLQIKKNNAALEESAKASDKAGDAIDETAKASDKAGDALDEAGDKARQSGDDAEKGGKGWDNLKNGLAAVGAVAIKAVAALGAAAVAAGTALVAASVSGAAYADDILTLSTQTGIATDTLQGYKYAAELVDVSTETLTKSMAKNIKSMKGVQDGTKLSVDAYNRLGVSVLNADGSMRDGQTVYWETIDALGQMQNETERDALAMQILGKSAQELNPLIEAGSERMLELAAKAQEAGYVLSGETLEAFGAFDDQLQFLKVGAEAAKNALGTILLPVLTELATDGTALLGEFTNGILDANGDIGQIGEAIGTTLSSLVNKIVERLPQIVEAGMGIISALGQGLMDNLPAIISAAVEIITMLAGGLVGALPQLVEAALQIILALSLGIADALPKLIPAIVETVVMIVETLIDNIDMLIDAAIAIQVALADGLIEALPKLLEKAPEIIIKLVKAIIENVPKMLEAAVALMVQLSSGIASGFGEILSKVGGWIDTNIIQPIKDKISDFVKIGGDLIKGVWQGISDKAEWLWGQVSGFFTSLTDRIKNFFGIASPSKLFRDEIGANLADGIGVGFSGQMKSVAKQMQNSIPTSFDSPSVTNARTIDNAMKNSASMMAAAVNAIGTKNGGNQHITVEIPLVLNGREFYRASINDLWSVMSSNPRVVSDAI